ncbi:hypothetical protein BH11PAT3_BH11PAT3_0070 [soil metagenome]
MLPTSHRMPRELFEELLKRSQYANSLHFSLRFKVGAPHSRFGVSVSKKISKSAVIRNSIRRRVYASLRDEIEHITPGLYLFMAKAGAGKIQGEKLVLEIQGLLKSAKVIV